MKTLAELAHRIVQAACGLLVVALAAGLTHAWVQWGPDGLWKRCQELWAAGTPSFEAPKVQAATGSEASGPQNLPLYATSSLAGELVPVSTSAAQAVLVQTVRQDPKGRSSEESTWEQLLEELERMGVRSYRLERCEGSGPKFCFCCWVPHGVRPGWVWEFRAKADSPAQALRQVVEHLKKWRRRSRPDSV